MADNVTVDNGTLTDYVVSADEGVGGQVQRVKLAYSADGSEVHVPADADGLLVNLGTNNDVTVSGVSTAANQSTEIGHLAEIETLLGGIDTKASTIANAVSGTEMQVDVVTMPTVTVQDGGGSLTVDGTVAVTGTVDLGATDNAVLDAMAASLAIVDNVVYGAGTEAAALRVTLATDSTGVVSVDDGGGSLTVDGTVAVSGTVAVTDNAASLTVDAPVATPVFVRLSDGSSAITTLPVSVASVPSHAVTNAGTFVTQENGAALTSLQLLDDSIVADDAAFTPGTTKVSMAGFEYDDTTPDSVNEGDAGAARMSANRNQYVQIRDNAGNERGLNVAADGSIAVTVATIPSHAVTNAGTFAVQAAQSGTWNVTNVSGTVSLPTGASTAANQSTIIGHVDGIETLLGTIDADTGALAATVSGTEVQVDVVAALPAGTNAIGKLAANSGVDIGDVDVTSVPLPTLAATSTVTSVNDAATSATLLSSNASRKGFRMYNDSTVACYVKFGTTATSTDYTVLLLPGAFLEENHYSGRVDGIWASDASGAMRITELT